MTDPPGVPLGELPDHVNGVGLWCEACNFNEVIPVPLVIERLNARGLDGVKIGIVELKRYVRGPCKACGATKWHTRPSWAFGSTGGPYGSPHGFVVPQKR